MLSSLLTILLAQPLTDLGPRSGWHYPRMIHTYVLAHKMTEDDDWLIVLDKHVTNILNNTDDKLNIYDVNGVSENKISTTAYSIDGLSYLVNPAGLGNYVSALSEYAIYYNELERPVIEGTIDFIEDSLNYLKRNHVKNTGDKEAFAFISDEYGNHLIQDYSPAGGELPLNMQSAIASAFLLSWHLFNKIDHPKKIMARTYYQRLACFIDSKLTYDDTLIWDYWYKDRVDDWGHASWTVRYIGLEYRYGVFYSKREANKVQNILEHYSPEDINGNIHPHRIDGTTYSDDQRTKYFDRSLSAYLNWSLFLHYVDEPISLISYGLSLRAQDTNLIHDQTMLALALL